MDLQEWVTLGGAVVAAATGTWNLALLMRGKRDRFILGSGTVSPAIYQETMLHVVSESDHPITLADWGFIDSNGRFSSILMDVEADPQMSEDIVTNGSSTLAARGDRFETGYIRREEGIGVFAKTVMQRRPRLSFDSSAPLWRRCWIRTRLRFQPHYLAW
jgi:hypothetical protein